MSLSPAERSAAKYVDLEIGGQVRRLWYDYNVLCEIEDATGVDLFDPQQRKEFLAKGNTPKALRLFVWACLYEESPRPTLIEVGRWVAEDHQRIAAAIATLQKAGHQDPKKGGARARPR